MPGSTPLRETLELDFGGEERVPAIFQRPRTPTTAPGARTGASTLEQTWLRHPLALAQVRRRPLAPESAFASIAEWLASQLVGVAAQRGSA